VLMGLSSFDWMSRGATTGREQCGRYNSE